MIKNNKKKLIIILLAIIIVAFVALFLRYNSITNKPLKSDDEIVKIEVADGEGLYNLLEKLNNEGKLKSKFFIKINLKLTAKDTKIVPGSYEVKRDITLEELIKVLETEDLTKNQVKVTVNEGYNIDKIGEVLEEKGLFSKDEFINAVKSYKLPDYVKGNSKEKYNLEGFLFPDTYYFNNNSKPEDVIKVMINKFENVLNSLEKETGKTVDKDKIEELVIKASLIEKEARLDEERPIVASVIENRVKKSMKLEFCSTVNYVIGYEDKEVLSYSDLKVESPYNTYKYSGLPAGAVASPGEKSLKAALKPDNTDYLYFVLLYGQNGKHHFSNNYEEHERVRVEQDKLRENASK